MCYAATSALPPSLLCPCAVVLRLKTISEGARSCGSLLEWGYPLPVSCVSVCAWCSCCELKRIVIAVAVCSSTYIVQCRYLWLSMHRNRSRLCIHAWACVSVSHVVPGPVPVSVCACVGGQRSRFLSFLKVHEAEARYSLYASRSAPLALVCEKKKR